MPIRLIIHQMGFMDPPPCRQRLVQKFVQIFRLFVIPLAGGFPEEGIHDFLEEEAVGGGIKAVDEGFFPWVAAVEVELFCEEDVDCAVF